MSDNPAIRGAQDRQRINLSQDHEVRYWTGKLGCTPEELRDAVEKVGPMAKDVEVRVQGRGKPGGRGV